MVCKGFGIFEDHNKWEMMTLINHFSWICTVKCCTFRLCMPSCLSLPSVCVGTLRQIIFLLCPLLSPSSLEEYCEILCIKCSTDDRCRCLVFRQNCSCILNTKKLVFNSAIALQIFLSKLYFSVYIFQCSNILMFLSMIGNVEIFLTWPKRSGDAIKREK